MLKFTEEHEWVRVEGDIGTVGITEHATEQLGDLVFVELPEVGRTLAKGDTAGTVESVKAASDIYAPVSGEVVEVNAEVAEHPEKVNEEPMGAGWLFKIRLSDPSELDSLMDEDAYKAMVG